MTLLELVNKVLKRISLVKGEAGELTSLTDSARQIEVDIIVQAVNEVLTDFYNITITPQKADEGKFTLAAGKREYNLPSDFEQFLTRPIDETNGNQLWPYPDGRGVDYTNERGPGDYYRMREVQTQPGAYTGEPHFYAISPENGRLRLDYAPTLSGRIYRYTYRKTMTVSLATDTINMSDEVVGKLMPSIKEIWNRERKEKFDTAVYLNALAGAARLLNRAEPRTRY